jgi:hypothetical protein
MVQNEIKSKISEFVCDAKFCSKVTKCPKIFYQASQTLKVFFGNLEPYSKHFNQGILKAEVSLYH